MNLSAKLKKISRKVKPLGDRLLIKRLEYQHPVLAVVGITLQKGIVIAAGPGKRQRRKIRFDKAIGHLSSDGALYFEDGEETGKVYPMPCKVGDIVEFSPRLQTEWDIDGENLVWISAKSIYGLSDEDTSNSLLHQESAGHDRHGNFMPGAPGVG